MICLTAAEARKCFSLSSVSIEHVQQLISYIPYKCDVFNSKRRKHLVSFQHQLVISHNFRSNGNVYSKKNSPLETREIHFEVMSWVNTKCWQMTTSVGCRQHLSLQSYISMNCCQFRLIKWLFFYSEAFDSDKKLNWSCYAIRHMMCCYFLTHCLHFRMWL